MKTEGKEPDLIKVIHEVVEKPNRLPAVIDDLDPEEGLGMENVDVDEFSIPFFVVLQTNSPECRDVRVGGLPGAKAGMFCNRATGELFDGELGVDFVAVHRGHKYIEYYPREEDGSGGGFVGVREANDPVVRKLIEEDPKRKFSSLPWHDEDGSETEINEIREIYALIVQDWNDIARCSKVNIPFGSSKIRFYKDWMALTLDINKHQMPDGTIRTLNLFHHKYKITTALHPKSNAQRSWYIAKVDLLKRPSKESLLGARDPIYQMAKEFYTMVASGQTKVDYAKAVEEVSPTEEENIPF